jgi:putative lipoic acid-binding regulatory protein
MKKQIMDKSSLDNAGEIMIFPCEFTIKVFGLSSNEFQATVFAIMRKHIPQLSDHAIQNRPSKDEKYNALSISFIAESREQLDTIYRELSSNPLILMVL